MSDLEHQISANVALGPNVALGKEALQSSFDQASRVKDTAGDASGGVNGEVTGGFGFHTGHETGPWWQVDLGGPHLIQRIVIYNRVDQPGLEDRALPLEIQLSDDGVSFRTVHVQRDRFGGKGSQPLHWSPDGHEQARLVRLTVPRLVCLHLDEVEVYGLPIRMGQTSALGSLDAFRTATPRADEVAPVDFAPAAAASAEPALDIMPAEPPRDVAAAQRPSAPVTEPPGTFLAKLRRALFGS